MKFLSLAAAVVIVAGTVYGTAFSQSSDSDLKRIECKDVTVFAPKNRSSTADICHNHGGVAKTEAAPTKNALVILVRNQPMGGFAGQSTLR